MQLKVTLTPTEVQKAITSFIASKGYSVAGSKVQLKGDGSAEVTLEKTETIGNSSYYDR